MKARIKEVRKDAGLTQEEFGAKLKLSRIFVTQVENGSREFSDRTIADICRIFGVNESWLRTGEGEMHLPKTRVEEITEIAQKAAANLAPGKRDALVSLLVGLLGPMSDAEIELLFEICQNHGWFKE